MKRIESRGSFWEIDEDLLQYRRWPKQEAPREQPGWSTGVLQDFVWLPYVSYEICNEVLLIHLPDRPGHRITAPL